MTQVQLIQVVQDRSFDGTGGSTVDVVKFGDDITTDFEFYLT